MSFGSACDACGIAYSSRGARGFFPDPFTVARPTQWRMLADVTRFYRDARRVIDVARAELATLGDWMDEHGYSRGFPRPFPDPDHVRRVVHGGRPDRPEFPVDYLLHFLDNHGLIGYGNSPQWRVVRGGSQAYVERLVAGLRWESVRVGDPVVSVTRDPFGVRS